MLQKYKVTVSKRYAHEGWAKETIHVMTVREVMAEVGACVMCGWEVLGASIDHCSLVETMPPDSMVSPQYLRYDIGESVVE